MFYNILINEWYEGKKIDLKIFNLSVLSKYSNRAAAYHSLLPSKLLWTQNSKMTGNNLIWLTKSYTCIFSNGYTLEHRQRQMTQMILGKNIKQTGNPVFSFPNKTGNMRFPILFLMQCFCFCDTPALLKTFHHGSYSSVTKMRCINQDYVQPKSKTTGLLILLKMRQCVFRGICF